MAHTDPHPISPQASSLLEQLPDLSTRLRAAQPGAREALLGVCSGLIAELSLPAESLLMLLWAQPTHHVVLRLAVELRLFEILAEEGGQPKGLERLCAEARAEKLLISRMMKHLAAMGTVRETDVDTYAATPLAGALTVPEFRDSVMFLQDDVLPFHVKAPEYFAQHGYKCPTDGADGIFQYTYDCKGENMFQYFARAPEMGRRFGSMMGAWAQDRPRWFDDGYYSVQDRLIDGAEGGEGDVFLVDVGGGRGHDLIGLKQKHQNIPGRLVLQDRPEVVSLAQLPAGLESMPHDFNTPQPIKGARAYFLHSIMQDWSDEECRHILRQLIPAMEKDYSKILLNEFVLPNKGAHWTLTSLDWELMSCLSARQRTEADHRGVIDSAGLKITGMFKHPQSGDSLLELELV